MYMDINQYWRDQMGSMLSSNSWYEKTFPLVRREATNNEVRP